MSSRRGAKLALPMVALTGGRNSLTTKPTHESWKIHAAVGDLTRPSVDQNVLFSHDYGSTGISRAHAQQPATRVPRTHFEG